MIPYCVRCGLTETIFLETGKFGCPDCHDTFFPGKLIRVPVEHKKLLTRIKDIKSVRKIEWSDVTYRLRLARCFRKGFFPFYTNEKDKTRSLLDRHGFEMGENAREAKVNADGIKFYTGDEDHLRMEWMQTPVSLAKNGCFHLPGSLRFLYEKGLWAWNPKVGFLNSCPTNCGRGDRLSVQARTNPESLFLILSSIGNQLGFSLEFRKIADESKVSRNGKDTVLVQISIKNANPFQKLRFFKILGLLGLV